MATQSYTDLAVQELKKSIKEINAILVRGKSAIDTNHQLYWLDYTRRYEGQDLSRSCRRELEKINVKFAKQHSAGQKIWSTAKPQVTNSEIERAIEEVGPHLFGLHLSASIFNQTRDGISNHLMETIESTRYLIGQLKAILSEAKLYHSIMTGEKENTKPEYVDRLCTLSRLSLQVGEQLDSLTKKLECLQETVGEIEELQDKAAVKAAIRYSYLKQWISEEDALDAYYHIDSRAETPDRQAQVLRKRCCWLGTHQPESHKSQTPDLADLSAIDCLREDGGNNAAATAGSMPAATSTPHCHDPRKQPTASPRKTRLGKGSFDSSGRANEPPGFQCTSPGPKPMPRHTLQHQRELQRLRAATRQFDASLLATNPDLESILQHGRNHPPEPPSRSDSNAEPVKTGAGPESAQASSNPRQPTEEDCENATGKAKIDECQRQNSIESGCQHSKYATAHSIAESRLLDETSSEGDSEVFAPPRESN